MTNHEFAQATLVELNTLKFYVEEFIKECKVIGQHFDSSKTLANIKKEIVDWEWFMNKHSPKLGGHY